MNCMDKQEDYLELKMEHQSDQYLFNQLLNCPALQQDRCIDDFLLPHIPLQQEFIQPDSPLTELHIISEVSRYINFKTTPMSEIMSYIEQFYPLPHSSTRSIYFAARKLKLRLKRQHAKKRPENGEKRQCYMQPQHEESLQQKEIKTEDSGLSPVLFVDESLETMKKKRNRMSAQNSRDRKKEYLEQIERQNQELKAEVARLSAQPLKKVAKPQTQEFLKVILCLGITCFLNIGPSPCLNTPLSKELIPVEAFQIPILKEEPFSKLNQINNQFNYFKGLLPMQNQQILDQFLGQASDGDNPISPSGQTMLKCLSLMEGNKCQYFERIKQMKDKLTETSPQMNAKAWISP